MGEEAPTHNTDVALTGSRSVDALRANDWALHMHDTSPISSEILVTRWEIGDGGSNGINHAAHQLMTHTQHNSSCTSRNLKPNSG